MLGFKPAQPTVLSLTAMSFERPSVIFSGAFAIFQSWVWTHEDAPHLGSASLALQGAVLASAVLKNSAIVVKIPYARTDPWPETPDLRVIYFDMF